jgi:transketolase
MSLNKDLRKKIIDIIKVSKEGHIPSSFSIIDILDYLYGNILNIDPKNPQNENRDYFVLSKGHAAAALFVVLNKYGILNDNELNSYGQYKSILGGHPDCTKVPGAEASTGSLGHGFPTAVGIAFGLKIKKMNNKVFSLVGDGECHEGTIWEAANISSNLKLNNLTVIVDRNKSAQQLMPIENMEKKWEAFGWNTFVFNGHDTNSMQEAFSFKSNNEKPMALIANTVKGKGVSFLEGHGQWHHKIPSDEEYSAIMKELKIL